MGPYSEELLDYFVYLPTLGPYSEELLENVSRLPWMVLFVVTFLAFGSVTMPLKSIILNLLSLSASFGAIKLIFQDGYLAGLLNFVPVGAVDINFPVLIVAIAFGLAMDYEVFLLSRVR
jgi:uncharacterized membrane protein YdfJ with MMPL/SSD domain